MEDKEKKSIEPDIVFCDSDWCGTSIIKVICPCCNIVFYQCQQCGELYLYAGRKDSNGIKIYEKE